ncbi:MAG: sigma-70 family RNA polymerase sigma factor [Planctomycetes bacterium]|nr:sigma-70 family RNA polymerase sigma factor [Planctomycetota bacterium]
MADPPTEMVPGGTAFPTTQWSRILRARDDSHPEYRRDLEQLLLLYWKPVYIFIRRSWGKSNEDAKDLTQNFFLEVLEKDLVSKYAPQRGRFRTFLKTALKHFLQDERRTAGRKKRGGGRAFIPLDADVLPLEEIATAPGDASPEACFDRAWANGVLADALRELEAMLKAEDREAAWRALELYDLSPPPGDSLGYREIAQKLQRSEGEVKTDLAYARQRLRQALTRRVRQYVADEKEVFGELKEILSL